jgi:uncharacterized membrane protein
MIIILVLLLIIAVVLIGTMAWYNSRMRGEAKKETAVPGRRFQISYIAAPMAVLLISLLLAIFLYRNIPDQVAYHYSAGEPDRWLGREWLLGWGLAIQVILILLGAAIVHAVNEATSRFGTDSTGMVHSYLTFMGNAVALPQMVVTFAIADAVHFNLTGDHFVPLWGLLITFIAAGIIFFGIAVIILVMRSRNNANK